MYYLLYICPELVVTLQFYTSNMTSISGKSIWIYDLNVSQFMSLIRAIGLLFC